ncbi:hypothetical protein, partial [Dactylosporangium sp. NPDC050588]|uniref:hypothetical protein n=1 Tax=Dactylosporangium sp. NPDC050588 TaxID=3157211 RepID=UPI0033CB0925
MTAVLSRAGAALLLAWRARPVLLCGYVAARLLSGALPALAAWLTKVGPSARFSSVAAPGSTLTSQGQELHLYRP